jgi:FkbM family methyltransferase
MSYSQNNEQELILQYFGANRIGTLLDIGANDGRSLSNSLAAIERGWSAVLIEPSPTAFEKLVQLHEGRNNISCFNIAIGEHDGEADFYESGEHIGNGDTSLISTLKETELTRWKGTRFDNFTKIKTDVVTWKRFYDEFAPPPKIYNLISVDCEGLDIFIVSQMDLRLMQCEMLIVEWNGKQFSDFNLIAEKAGMKLYDKNNENLIFVK